jgi:hypothetical protein
MATRGIVFHFPSSKSTKAANAAPVRLPDSTLDRDLTRADAQGYASIRIEPDAALRAGHPDTNLAGRSGPPNLSMPGAFC